MGRLSGSGASADWAHSHRSWPDDKAHPTVTCLYCSSHWRSNSLQRLHAHLSKCPGLPEQFWEKWQPSRTSAQPTAPIQVPAQYHAREQASTTSSVPAKAPWHPHTDRASDDWRHVGRDYSNAKTHPVVTCNYCSAQWASNSLQRLYHHFARCEKLPQDMWEKWQPERGEGDAVPPPPKRIRDNEAMTAAEQVAAEEALVVWIDEANIPLGAIDSPSFRRFMELLRPGFRVPLRRELSEMLPEKDDMMSLRNVLEHTGSAKPGYRPPGYEWHSAGGWDVDA
nr:hypothetical protein B0A51_04152 [Rachicladosporium sp. CCFEE 5018]